MAINKALNKYSTLNAFALTGRRYYGKSVTQGVASLALGYVLLGFQPVQACIIGIPQCQSTTSTSFTLKFQPYARLDI